MAVSPTKVSNNFRVSFARCLFVIAVFLQFRTVNPSYVSSESQYTNLKKDLGFMGGGKAPDRFMRPVKHFSDTLNVNLSLIILHVHSLDELTGTLKINGLADITWIDVTLTWNPSDYGGIEYIHIPNNLIWQPDITLYNNDEALEINHYGDTMLFLKHNGEVISFPPFTLWTSCPIDHTYFPFDEHTCYVRMGSWIYSADFMSLGKPYDVHPEQKLFDKYFVENPLWQLVETKSDIIHLALDCCPDSPFPFLEMKLLLRRRSPFHKYFVIVPSLAMIAMALAMFWFPPYSGEKITLGGIVALIQTLMLLSLAFTIPPGGLNVPKIVLFCGNSLIMTCVSLIISVGVIRISRTSMTMPVPWFIKKLLSRKVRFVLFLPQNYRRDEPNFVFNRTNDGNFDVDETQANTSAFRPELQQVSIPSAPSDWLLLAEAIDHFFFIIYIFAYSGLIVSCIF